MRDTSVEAATVQIDAFRRLSPAERVALAFEASDWMMAIARARTPKESSATSPAGAREIDALPAVRKPQSR